MKYFFSLLLSIAIISVATAQDFKKVETNVYLKKFEDAKTEIDKSMADPKTPAKAEGYYWKSRIYAALFQNEATRAKYPTAVEDAHAAFQKYAEMDPALAKVKEKGADGYFDMYATSFGVGINSFKEKKYEAASRKRLFTVIIFSKINGQVLNNPLILLLFYIVLILFRMHKSLMTQLNITLV